MLLRYTCILLCLVVTSALNAQLNINYSGSMRFGTNENSAYRYYLLNSQSDYGLMLRTTKNSGGYMRGIVNEIRQTKYENVTLAFVNDVQKPSNDYKPLYGVSNYLRHRGSGSNTGIQNVIYGYGTGMKRGLYNNVQDNLDPANASSDEPMYGVYNYLQSIYRPRSYASYNLLVNNNMDPNDQIFGVYVEESGSGSANTFGVYSVVDNRKDDYAGFFLGKVYINDTYSGSDKKLKKDIKELTSALSIIDSLRPTSYHFNASAGKSFDQEKLHYGFIAQDLERILPDLVTDVAAPARYTYDDEYLVNGDTTAVPQDAKISVPATTHKAIRYMDLIAILTQAIKEQQLDIKDVKKLQKSLAKSNGQDTAFSIVTERLSQENTGMRGQITRLEQQVLELHTQRELSVEAEERKGEAWRDELRAMRTEMERMKEQIAALQSCTDCPGGNGLVVPTQSSGSLLSVYPNPASGQVTIDYPHSTTYRVKIIGSNGREYATVQAADRVTKIDIVGWPAGSYIFEVYDNGVLVDGKSVIVQR